jgi:GcrA cell cycle regulator
MLNQPTCHQQPSIHQPSTHQASNHQPSTLQTWTTERIEQLKLRYAEGLSCREIAAEIGVSRNAVIGKISRLALTRDKGYGKTLTRKDAAAARPKPGARLRQLLIRVLPAAELASALEPIHNGHTCSLFELSRDTCRWPISTPGAEDFCFCGNPPIEGLPYCPGHSRLAYRVGAQR